MIRATIEGDGESAHVFSEAFTFKVVCGIPTIEKDWAIDSESAYIYDFNVPTLSFP